MESSTHSKSPKDKTFKIVILLCLIGRGGGQISPHQVYRLTWQVVSQTGDIIWKKTENHPLYTWWPTLTPDFCSLAAGLDTWDIPGTNPDTLFRRRRALVSSRYPTPGCSSQAAIDGLARQDFYVCPSDGRTREKARQCGALDHYHCAAWGCETTGDAYWRPSSTWDKIKVTRGWPKGAIRTTSLPLSITFTNQGKLARE